MGTRNIGECFVRVCKLRDMNDKEYLQEFIDYDGIDSSILDDYTVDMDADCEYASMLTREELNAKLVGTDLVSTKFMYGSEFDRRCWGSTIQVYELEDGSLYMDEGLMDDAFA